jgi:hypothetical protein
VSCPWLFCLVGLGIVLLGVGIAFPFYRPPEPLSEKELQMEREVRSLFPAKPLLDALPAPRELQLEGTARVAVPAGLVLILAGLAVATLGVQARLRQSSEQLAERIESSALLGVAAITVLLARVAFSPWDSGRYFFNALTVVALAGSLLVLIPRLARRIVVSFLVLFHFGCILTAVTAVEPNGQPAPWLSQQLWSRVYRPYICFMYLGNAYHFYSPDPGPPSLLWFRIHYKDKTARWYKIPTRGEDPVALHYQRFLALAEGTNKPVQRLPLTAIPLPDGRLQQHPLVIKRWQAGLAHNPPIPLPSGWLDSHYQEPQFLAKELASSYARHVAHAESKPVESIQVYRITHLIPQVYEIAEGGSPLDETKYAAFFMGRFDPEGRLMDPDDGFLYWCLPILYVAPNSGQAGIDFTPDCNRMPQKGDVIFNGLKIHAGDITPE